MNLNRIIPGSLCFVVFVVISFFFSLQASANNLAVTNVTLEDRFPSTDSVVVEFDVSWSNSWRTKINHDAIWLTVRLYSPTSSPTSKKLCQLTASGLNPSGSSIGSNSALEIYVPIDKSGVFIRPSNYGVNSSVSSQDVQLTVNYNSCGFSDTDTVYASVFGLEMVYIPQGAFYAGDYTTSTAALDQGSSDTDPWYISSESAVTTSNATSNGFRYVSNSNTGEDLTGSTFTIFSSYPKGYGAFYVMKYEVNEGQWGEFINSLPSSAARANRDLTDSAHKNTDSVKFRNTLGCSGSPLSCSTNRSARAVNYLSWMDLAAFLDWAALRPMTELEYEKMSRGPLLAEPGEFAFGSTTITAATTISGSAENGSETITNSGTNAHYNDITLSGGDTGSGTDYQKGPLRTGIFAISSSTRESAGAGYYGVMELSGNVTERVVTIGNVVGRNFIGSHGDGYLSTSSGSEGNATNIDWPGIDTSIQSGVTGSDGSGFRGGSWQDVSSRLRISDRYDAARSTTSALNSSGGRGVKTYDGN